MALDGLLHFFDKLRIKDDTDVKSHPEDENLLIKIREGSSPKYINLETGRTILPASADKKKFISHEMLFCGDDSKQFERISKKLRQRVEKPKEETAKKIIKPRPKSTPTPQAPKVAKGAPPKRKAVPKTLRHHLWMRDYGNISEAKCLCCGVTTITESTAEAGHIIAFSKGGSTDADNLRLICRTCNADMGIENMDEFMRANNFPVKS